MKPVLVGTKEPGTASQIQICLGRGFKVTTASNHQACLEIFRGRRFEYTFLDIQLLFEGGQDPEQSLATALRAFRQASAAAPLIVLSSPEQVHLAVEAVKAGAQAYLTFPIVCSELELVLQSLGRKMRLEAELSYLRDQQWRRGVEDDLRTRSPLMQEVLERVHSVAPTRATVLLTGETGTGKSYLARVIHLLSNRAQGPLVKVHCGALPESLLESELFGHEKGAFTGAVRRKPGKFQIAGGGTILLDEIGTLSPSAQVKLLQVLQDRIITRVGGEVPIEVDVRVIAATNDRLEELCEQGKFRRDLYYRLNVFSIELPPLRDRREDIPFLVEELLARLNREDNKQIQGMQPEVAAALQRYAWPGNIRELQNLVERAYILEKANLLSPGGFPLELFATGGDQTAPDSGSSPSLAQVREQAVNLAERQYLHNILTLHGGRMDRAAQTCGVTTRQLRNLLAKHGLRKEDFK